MVRLVWMEGAVWVVGWITLVVALGLLGDWLFDWPAWVRGLGLLVDVGTGAWAVWRFGFKALRAVPAGDRLALYLERREPGLRSRLISAVQLGRSEEWNRTADGAAYVRRLMGEAERVVSTLDLRRLVPADGLLRAVRRMGPVVLVAGLVWAMGGTTIDILLRRALGADEALPRRTRLVEVTGNRVVGRGDDLAISALVEGVVPKAGQILLRHASGRVQTLVMDADAGRVGRFERVLGNLTTRFRYRVRVNDAESAEFDVEVLPRPAVTNLDLTLQLPAYTGLPARSVAPGELTLLRGSRLTVSGRASQPLAEALVHLEGLDTEVPAILDPLKPERFVIGFRVDDPRWTGFSMRLTDVRGIGSLDPAVYAVSVVEDAPPVVRVILPSRREELVTPRGSVLIAFEAKDDYGLAGLRLMYQPAASTNATVAPTEIELDLGAERSDAVRRRFEWKLSEIRPPVEEGAFLEFWVEALDRREAGGAGIGRSERYLARVVSEAEKRSDLLTRAGDAIGRLGDVAQGQERLNESLGRIILEKATPR